jgi:hypothetical protein
MFPTQFSTDDLRTASVSGVWQVDLTSGIMSPLACPAAADYCLFWDPNGKLNTFMGYNASYDVWLYNNNVLSDTYHFSVTPGFAAIGIDSAGYVYISGAVGGGGGFYKSSQSVYSPPGPNPWDCDGVPLCTPPYAGRKLASLAAPLDRMGMQHCVQEYGCSIYYSYRTVGSTTWSTPMKINDGPLNAIKPYLTLEVDGGFSAWWEEVSNDMLGTVTIRKKQSRDRGATWTVVI